MREGLVRAGGGERAGLQMGKGRGVISGSEGWLKLREQPSTQ